MELLRGIHTINAQHKGCVLGIGVGFNMSMVFRCGFLFFVLQKVVN